MSERPEQVAGSPEPPAQGVPYPGPVQGAAYPPPPVQAAYGYAGQPWPPGVYPQQLPTRSGLSTGAKVAIGLAIALPVGIVFLGILALAAVPLITHNARDARRAEAEVMMGSFRSQVRAVSARIADPSVIVTLTGSPAPVGTGCNVLPHELQGKYYIIQDELITSPMECTIVALPLVGSDGAGSHSFAWSGGEGRYTWPK